MDQMKGRTITKQQAKQIERDIEIINLEKTTRAIEEQTKEEKEKAKEVKAKYKELWEEQIKLEKKAKKDIIKV